MRTRVDNEPPAGIAARRCAGVGSCSNRCWLRILGSMLRYICGVIGVATGIALGIVLLFMLASAYYAPLADLAAEAGRTFVNGAPTKVEMTKADSASLQILLKKGHVTTLDNLVGNLISYYSAIITAIMGVIGILALVGFFYVRQASATHAREAMVHARDAVAEEIDQRWKAQAESRDFYLKVKGYADENSAILRREIEKNFSQFMDDIGENAEYRIHEMAERADKKIATLAAEVRVLSKKLSILETADTSKASLSADAEAEFEGEDLLLSESPEDKSEVDPAGGR